MNVPPSFHHQIKVEKTNIPLILLKLQFLGDVYLKKTAHKQKTQKEAWVHESIAHLQVRQTRYFKYHAYTKQPLSQRSMTCPQAQD